MTVMYYKAQVELVRKPLMKKAREVFDIYAQKRRQLKRSRRGEGEYCSIERFAEKGK